MKQNIPGVMLGVWGVCGVMAPEGVAPGVCTAGVSSQRERRLLAPGVGVSWWIFFYYKTFSISYTCKSLKTKETSKV